MPNITGNVGSNQDRPASGAFTATQNQLKNSGNDNYATNVRFSARNGETKTNGSIKTASEHHVYGAANGVQPQNISIRLWKRIS